MRFQFDPGQSYQADAISAVTDLFDGQPADADQLLTSLCIDSAWDRLPFEAQETRPGMLDVGVEIGALGNNLVLDEDTILANLQRVQDRNGLESSDGLVDGLQFDIEMETGTGKTYVYLRTAFELARRYRFTKFIILVPSVPIREGVRTSIELMREHFRHLYPDINMDALVYSGIGLKKFGTSLPPRACSSW